PPEVSAAQVGERLERVRADLGLEAVAVAEVDELGHTAHTATHVLSVYGADRLGIVHGVSQALAELGVNICDLQTRVTGSEDAPVYVMLLEVALGPAAPAEVERALRAVGGETGVEVNLRELDSEAL